MLAAVLKQFNAPLVVEETTNPTVEPGWVLVKVKACGLCGTDLKIISGMMPMVSIPLIPGHEVAGEILEVGEGVTHLAIGDRIAVYMCFTCKQCDACRQGWDTLCFNSPGIVGFNVNGGFAEIVKVPAADVLPIYPKTSYEEAAILTDAVATPYRALLKIARAQAGQTVALVGVGGLGLHAVQIAKVMGLRVLAVDVNQEHLKIAATLGAEVVINPAKEDLAKAINTTTGGRGVEVLLEMSGNPQMATDGVLLLAPRGRMVIVGYHVTQPFQVSSKTLMLKEIEICGSCSSTKQDLAEVIDWVGTGRIKPIIQEVMPLSHINEGYQKIKRGQVTGRIVIQP